MNYKDYITSKEWRAKHKEFLREASYRCAFSGLKIGRKHGYNCHYMHYQNLGDERYRRDIVCLHPWFHTWIIHGILSGFKRPSKQSTYPNGPQRAAHLWCILPISSKLIILISLLGGMGYGVGHMLQNQLRVAAAWGTSTQFLIRAAYHIK